VFQIQIESGFKWENFIFEEISVGLEASPGARISFVGVQEDIFDVF
jgi:hypothetical protein